MRAQLPAGVASSLFVPMLLSAEFLFGSLASATPLPPKIIDNTALLAPVSDGDESRNWAGYVSEGEGVTAVTGSWIVPQVTLGSTLSADATWVGIGGITDHNLIQAGTQAISDPEGGVQYQAWIEGLPNESTTVPLEVRPGDLVEVELHQDKPVLWKVSLVNETLGKRFETEMQYDSTGASAEWIEELPAANVSVGLDAFNTVDFLKASATRNGKEEAPQHLPIRALTMVNGAGETLALPSKLSEADGSFRVSRMNAEVVDARDNFQFDMSKPAIGNETGADPSSYKE